MSVTTARGTIFHRSCHYIASRERVKSRGRGERGANCRFAAMNGSGAHSLLLLIAALGVRSVVQPQKVVNVDSSTVERRAPRQAKPKWRRSYCRPFW